MPHGSPFTVLCSRMSRLAMPRRADLHVHTRASDGEYTPSQVVALARQAGLCAVAISDHDTLAGYTEARATASTLTHPGIEAISAVELTTEFAEREFHLLGYFVQPDHNELSTTLARLCERRRERFHELIARLADRGIVIPEDRVALVERASASLGRRHVAALLVGCGRVRTRHEAFQRYLGSLRGMTASKAMVPIADAIDLIHSAGGVASLAHPTPDLSDADFSTLASYGLDALECEYAWSRTSIRSRLREQAARLGLLITGGSDCHGPDPSDRHIGSHGITAEQLQRLRDRAGSADRAVHEVASGC